MNIISCTKSYHPAPHPYCHPELVSGSHEAGALLFKEILNQVQDDEERGCHPEPYPYCHPELVSGSHEAEALLFKEILNQVQDDEGRDDDKGRNDGKERGRNNKKAEQDSKGIKLNNREAGSITPNVLQ